MLKFSEEKKNLAELMDILSSKRELWIKKNNHYYQDLLKFYKYNIPENSKILEMGCGIGQLLYGLKPRIGVGIDISEKMIWLAKKKYATNTNLIFYQMDAENITLRQKFDYIILSDTIGHLDDVEKVFWNLRKVINPNTRIIINFQSFLWLPILNCAEKLGLKMHSRRLNWLNYHDIANILYLCHFEVIKYGRRYLFPKYVPIISTVFNKYFANMPLFNNFCLTNFVIAKQDPSYQTINKLNSVSIIVPAKNEKGNIENTVLRTPLMGKSTEIIFVEGHSTDGTLEEIKRVCNKYHGKFTMRYTVQNGKGKNNAVKKGFNMAKGDILMILDADLSTPPEDLPKFYNAISTGKGEFINGCRLVYPMEKEAMRALNILGNKFFSIMFTWLLGQKIKDTLCGTKVISKDNYNKLIKSRGYFGNFDPFGDFDLLFGAAKLNLKIIEVPIRYKARAYGFTNISRFKHGLTLLKMVIFAMNKIKFI